MSRYIDADMLYVDWYDSFVADDGTIYDNFPLISKEQIDDAPSINIIFCKDCKFWKKVSSCMSKRPNGYCDEGIKENENISR